MALLLNDIFDTVRERLGGWEEAELEVRFPDSRIYKHYKHFKRELANFFKQAELSVASITVTAATNYANLGLGDRRIKAAYFTETDGSLTLMTPASLDFITAAQGQFNTDKGNPTHYWIEGTGTAQKTGTCTVVHTSSVYSTLSSMTTAIATTDVGKIITILGVDYLIRTYISTSSCTVYSNGTLPVAGTGVTWTINSDMQLVVYPQPETDATIILQGEGAPIYEVVSYDSENMLATDVQATIPEVFEDGCIDYLVWRVKQSAEEFDDAREAIAEAAYEKSMMKCRRRWGMIAPHSFWMKNNAVGQGPIE